MTFEERLDAMELEIRKPIFRKNRGRANEVNYWVFDYPPEKELEVRARIERMQQKNATGNDDFKLVVFDLYDYIIDTLEKEGFLDQCYRFEDRRGIDRIVKAVGNLLCVNDDDSLIVRHIEENTPENAIVFLTGIGKALQQPIAGVGQFVAEAVAVDRCQSADILEPARRVDFRHDAGGRGIRAFGLIRQSGIGRQASDHAILRQGFTDDGRALGGAHQGGRSTQNLIAAHHRQRCLGRMHGADVVAHHDLIKGQSRWPGADVIASEPARQRRVLHAQQQLATELGMPQHALGIGHVAHALRTQSVGIDDHRG